MVKQKENEVDFTSGVYRASIELINGEVSIWTKQGNHSTLAYLEKEEAIELFTRALKLLQDEKDI
jgi:hypothetical protein